MVTPLTLVSNMARLDTPNTWVKPQTFYSNISIGGDLSVTGTGGIFAALNTWTALQTFSLLGTPLKTSNNTLDDGSGNMSIAGTLLSTGLGTFSAGITGTGNTGSLTAGSGILGTANTWSALQTFNGNTLGNNYQINGGYRFWGNDSNGVVMFLGADAYQGAGNQILDFGVNTTQQANSGGLPAPTATYGGGLFRFDLRTGNPSTLTPLAGAKDNAEFYVLLQPSGTTGEGAPIFGCTANGIVGTIRNTLDDGSGNMSIDGTLGLTANLRLYSNIATAGLGVSAIYAAALLVSLGTTSATIATYTPTSATGQQFKVTWVLSAAAATTPTLTLTFTDPKAGAQTITLFSSAMTADTVATGTYSIVATSAAAITAAGSALIASDIFATVTIEEIQ